MLYDALVIGGGPAGATTALRLARAGWSVALVEQSEFPRRKVCGEFISATTLPLLAKLGVLNAFLQQAGPEIRRTAVYAGDAIVEAAMPAATGAHRWGRALGREHLDTLLLQEAKRSGVHIWQPMKVLSLTQERERVCCRIGSAHHRLQERLQARVVIAAHGASTPGALPGQDPRRASSPRDLFGFKAHFIGSALASDLMPVVPFSGGYAGVVHTDRARVSFACCIRRDMLKLCRRAHPARSAGDSVYAYLLRACRGLHGAMSDAQPAYGWATIGPIRPQLRPLYCGRVFMVGNAGGEPHPLIGEGISLAIQGGWLLAETLAANRAALAEGELDLVGERYAGAWRDLFATRVRRSAVVATLATHPAATLVAVTMLKAFPHLLTLGARLNGKTTSPLPCLEELARSGAMVASID